MTVKDIMEIFTDSIIVLEEQKLDLNCNEYFFKHVLTVVFISLRMWIEFDLF